MVCVFAANKVPYYKEGQFLSTAKKLVDESDKEEGCITYELCVKDDSYIFFERWESKEALEKHKKTSHYTECVPKMETLRTSGETIVMEKLF